MLRWQNFGSRLLALAMLAFLTACQVELYSNLDEREANQVAAALMNAGISVEKVRGRDGITVMVDEGKFAQAVDLLKRRGLPTANYESMGDVFEKSGIVSSPTEERARYIYALSQELGNTVAEIDGVLSARVHVVLPETDILGRQFKPSSASVFVRHLDNINVQKLTPHIKMLVANSIEGLIYEKVSVIMVPAVDVMNASFETSSMVAAEETSINFMALLARILLVILLISSVFYFVPSLRTRVIELVSSRKEQEEQ